MGSKMVTSIMLPSDNKVDRPWKKSPMYLNFYETFFRKMNSVTIAMELYFLHSSSYSSNGIYIYPILPHDQGVTQCLSNYLPIAKEGIVRFILFTRVLALREMQTDSFRIWTRVAVSISYCFM